MEEESQPQAQQDPEHETELKGLLEEVESILSFSERRETEILKLFGTGAVISYSAVSTFKKQSSAFFSEGEIKTLATNNRLRFLPVSVFCGQIPYEAVRVIKSYQHRYADCAHEFYILAPSDFFLLKDKFRNPLLFCKTKNGYHLLCLWGEDFSWYHSIIRYPLRDFTSLMICSLVAGFIAVVCASFMGVGNDDHFFKSILFKIPLLVLSSGFIATLAICFGLVRYIEFSEDNWRSGEF